MPKTRVRRVAFPFVLVVLVLAGLVDVALAGVAAPASGSSGAQTILALVQSGSRIVVARVDARTLRPLRGASTSSSLGASFELRWTYSPDGRTLALAGTSLWDVDVATLRARTLGQPALNRNAVVWLPTGLYQTDGNLFDMLDTKGQLQDWGAGRSVAALLLGGQTSDQSGNWFDIQVWPQPAVGDGGFVLPAFAGKDFADVALAVSPNWNRAFVVASDGTSATMTLRPPWTIAASKVALPSSFGAASARTSFHVRWVNSRTVAVVGTGGLALIDLHLQTSQLLDPTANRFSIGQAGIVGWNGNTASGVSVYDSDGTLHFRALAGQHIGGVVVGDRYVYACAGIDVWACKGTTFVLDAHTGAVAARVNTRIVLLVRGTERDGH